MMKRRIQLIREKMSMSQAAMAQLCGISRSMLCRYEKFDRNFRFQTAFNIATRLHMHITYLFPEFKGYVYVRRRANG